MAKKSTCEKIVDNFIAVGTVLLRTVYFLVFAEITCYTGYIENCTQAQGRRAGGVLFVCRGEAQHRSCCRCNGMMVSFLRYFINVTLLFLQNWRLL